MLEAHSKLSKCDFTVLPKTLSFTQMALTDDGYKSLGAEVQFSTPLRALVAEKSPETNS